MASASSSWSPAPERRLEFRAAARACSAARGRASARGSSATVLRPSAAPPGGSTRWHRRRTGSPSVVESHGPIEADDAVLDQIAERHAATAVALGDRDHEPQVRVDHALLRSLIALLDRLGEDDFLGRGQQRVAADLGQKRSRSPPSWAAGRPRACRGRSPAQARARTRRDRRAPAPRPRAASALQGYPRLSGSVVLSLQDWPLAHAKAAHDLFNVGRAQKFLLTS